MTALLDTGWSSECPTEPGAYWFTCSELNGDVETLIVIQELHGEVWELWVDCPATGSWPVDIYHANLIAPTWKRKE